MAHITLNNDLPGIVGLLAYRPETAKPLTDLATALLTAPSSLSRGERELIATHVSLLNGCNFCSRSHAAIAKHLLPPDSMPHGDMRIGIHDGNLSDKMKILLGIAGYVQENQPVPSDLIEQAKEFGATDIEIHDTVLIGAAFCMFNRYVDGLGTYAPTDDAAYDVMGKHLAENGYK